MYDGSKFYETKAGAARKFNMVQSNIMTAMKDREIKSIKRILGGFSRDLCIVEHDENEQTIYQYRFTNTERDTLVFQQLVAIDINYILASSSLINENKLLVRNVQNNLHYTLNVDMKVYWQVDTGL